MSNRLDSALRLFEELDGLNDTLIEEGMLPDDTITINRPRRTRRAGQNPLLRFFSSGWGVAILCAVVSLGAVTALVRVGTDQNSGAAPDEEPLYASPDTAVPPLREEIPTLPDESDRVPAGTRSADEHGLEYVSYGDGTCICSPADRFDDPTVLHIPDYSPDGDVVVAIDSYLFRNCLGLREVTLPAGLRELDHRTFPMEAPIYNLYGNVLYLGSRDNPYMVAVATADNRPGATALHPHTRIIACHALTYDAGTYFALAWQDSLPAYTNDEVFTLPSGITHIGEYGLLDVGRDITYGGYLVGWDALTAGDRKGLVRTVDGSAVTVTCLDGTTVTAAAESREVRLDSTARYEDGVLFGGYFTYFRGINEDYYAWMRNPDAFDPAPDQFVTESAVYGTESRVLTARELASVTFTPSGITDEALLSHIDAYNRDPAALYARKSVVMLYLHEISLYEHTVQSVSVTDGHIHVTLARIQGAVSDSEGDRFLLIPIDDPDGALSGATVSFEISEEADLPGNEN